MRVSEWVSEWVSENRDFNLYNLHIDCMEKNDKI